MDLPDGFELRDNGQGLALAGDGMVLRADFARLLPRLRPDRLGRELLVRAARVRGVGAPTAVDATAGLGEDSLLLAAAGFTVTMFEKDPETKKIGFTHNPFSMPQGGLEALNTKDPLDILAYQYDIVCNGVELSSGAVRNHDMQIMVKAFEIAGYDEEVLKEKFGALYNAFQYGAPPHAGIAPGIDRMIMLLTNEENIREVIAFPMSGTAQDLMCGAPNEVTEQQLREVHIKVRD